MFSITVERLSQGIYRWGISSRFHTPEELTASIEHGDLHEAEQALHKHYPHMSGPDCTGGCNLFTHSRTNPPQTG